MGQRTVLLLALAAVALALTLSASAAADVTFCTLGSGAGQCDRPEGIAVDRSNGHVYLADKRNSRIDVFDSSGGFLFAFGYGVTDGVTNAPQTCTVTCFKGIEGSGPGQQVPGETALAMDNDPASPSYRDLYVAERDNFRVQKFSPDGEFILMLGKGVNKTTGKNICTAKSGNTCGPGAVGGGDGEFNANMQVGVGPGGELLVADTVSPSGHEVRVQSFDAEGAFIEEVLQLSEPERENSLAVNSIGDFYLGYAGDPGRVEKYDPSGTLLEVWVTYGVNALAVDGSDHLLASETDFSVGKVPVITEYDPVGNILRRFGYGSIGETPRGLAASSTAQGDVFAAELGPDRVQRLSAPPPGPVTCCLDAIMGNTKATLKAGVNPEGKATTYHIDYLNDEAFKSGGFSNPATKSTAETPLGSDFNLHDAQAQIGCVEPEVPAQSSCLFPDTLYHYRLLATNEDGKSQQEGTFTTKPPLEITETYATDVGTDSAQLHVTVNPLGIPAVGYFEYTTEAAYQADLAEGEGHDGFAGAVKNPDVDNGETPISFGAGEAPKGEAAGLFNLKPGTVYRYRLVAEDPFVEIRGSVHSLTTFPVPSPPENVCPNQAFHTGPAALLPDCRAYEMVSPVDKNGGEIKVLGSTLNYPARLEVSSADGNRFAYSSITAFGDAVSAPWTSEYIATRKEGEGWSTHAINPARETKSLTLTPAFKWDVQYKVFSPDLSNGWLIHDTEPPLDECAPAGNLNLYRRDNTTGAYEALTINPPTDIGSGGYELELQGVSADGSHTVIRANGKLTPDAATKGLSQVYMHIQDPEGGCGELRLVSVLPNGKPMSTVDSSLGTFAGLPGESRGSAVSHAISADGSRAFWSGAGSLGTLYLRDFNVGETVQVASGSPQFWDAAADGSKALYSVPTENELENLFEFNSARALAKEPASTLVAEGTKGVAATSEDMSRIYFVSFEALGGEGEEGKPNLYLNEVGGDTNFIATLHGSDEISKAFSMAKSARATADGAHLAFVSAGNSTGYDNIDASGDGRRNREVYLYDVGTDHLACISCNPSGARPAGRGSKEALAVGVRVSAKMSPAVNQFFAPRALSSDGNRLFFESFEALLARDTNGKGDVYEWQRAGSQEECDQQGAELYVPSAGGCLSLISTGQSPVDSEFADASPDGSDVFIRTSSSLSPQDPSQVDLYDARINGGLPQPPGPPAACEGEACQGPLAAPNDPTPSSSAFEGAGNVNEAPARCRKPKVHRKGRCVAKRRKPAKHAKSGRLRHRH